jgi:hypothetical protein
MSTGSSSDTVTESRPRGSISEAELNGILRGGKHAKRSHKEIVENTYTSEFKRRGIGFQCSNPFPSSINLDWLESANGWTKEEAHRIVRAGKYNLEQKEAIYQM